MSKVILFNMMTIDGLFEGPNKEIGWHNVDDEFNDLAIEQLNNAGMLIFGRLTYELMAGYWPKPDAIESDPVVAGKMNSLPKTVFSSTLKKSDWANTLVINGDIEKNISRMKRELKKDIFVFGSSDLASEFRRLNLIDEYRIMINPIILGKGNPLFKVKDGIQKMKLLRCQTFKSGNVLICYQPVK
jgi:dihydrofolate reductase